MLDAAANWPGANHGKFTKPRPGSAGIGDSYFPEYGNGGYDVDHYDIRLTYDPETDKLTGITTISARASHSLSRFNLDFLLDVAMVQVDGKPATFTRAGSHELVVIPNRPIPQGRHFTVTVRYAGVPSTVAHNGVTAWRRTADGAFALGEPEVAWWWFPSNDHPTDKATFSVSALVPDGVEVISNGFPVDRPRPESPGWTRWSWRTISPISTYLALFVAGQYDLVTSTAPNGQLVINAFSTALGTSEEAARASIDRTAEIVAWESGILGPYPFETQGGVVAPPETIRFAMETATRPVYSSGFWARGESTYVIVHELAHQWYGNAVSVARWRDIWLNEGFATYMEWMWAEAQGQGTAQEFFDYTYAWEPETSAFWQVPPGDPGPENLFHPAVYDRGAMALHQVRVAVGEQAFRTTMRRWYQLKSGGVGTIAQFQKLAESISGRDLDEVFTTWLYTKGRPKMDQPDTVSAPLSATAAPPASASTAAETAGIPGSGSGTRSGTQSGVTQPVKPAAWDEVRLVSDLHRARVTSTG
ncbi:MAG: M1 family metallopeptidase [Micromonosporaceae bacterium]|nr:M1 family metallopeptidase [Micromonosporaceae bacterium]